MYRPTFHYFDWIGNIIKLFLNLLNCVKRGLSWSGVRTGCSQGCNYAEQMSPLRALFSYTHGLYYHHEIKLTTCPFRHNNGRLILGR